MRILIIDLLNIGDLLFISPALRCLRAAYPKAQIDALVTMQFQEVLSDNPNIDRIIGMDKFGYHKSARHFLELTNELRASGYDMAIDFHGCSKSMLLALMSGAKRRVGMAADSCRIFYHQPVKQLTSVHRVESYLDMIRKLNIPAVDCGGMEMHISAQSQESADKKWDEAGISTDSPVIGLNPGARVQQRQWPAVKWIELTDMLYASGLKCVLFGGPGDVDIATEISTNTKRPLSVFAGKLTLQELAAMIAKCAVFVTGDTGPMHIAAAYKIPTVALFGPADPNITGPYKVRNIVCKSDDPCPGCLQHSTDARLHTCMNSINAEEVTDSIKTLLL